MKDLENMEASLNLYLKFFQTNLNGNSFESFKKFDLAV